MNWRRHAFLLAHDLIGSDLRAHYREFLSLPEMGAARLRALHEERLDGILRHAVEKIPYYRKRAATPELSAFPVLRKDDIHAHFEEMMEPSLLSDYKSHKRAKGYSWVEVKTGGSTGTPTTVIHDKDYRDWGRSARLYSQYLCGFPIGTPFFMLWGSMRDISDARDSQTKRILNALLQVHPMNAFLMDEARMEGYIGQINTSSIQHLMAYVDAAYQLAGFAEQKGLAVRPIESVMACAGTVTDELRTRLRRVFGARVHNKYGSRECADMACECSRGGFHIYETGVHIEIVDDDGRPVPAGTAGRILVTLLLNRRFPIIRYEIGDVGALRGTSCACGSPLALMERVEGRISEFVTSAGGAYVSPVYIRHLIGVVHNPGAIERFQFVQTATSDYSLALQMDTAFPNESFDKLTQLIRRDLEKVLGDGARLTITREARIAESESGKFLYVRNLVQ